MCYPYCYMIRTLTGEITHIGNNNIVINVGGIGYLVSCPTLVNNFQLSTTITLHTYLAVRETALDLYGFPQSSELEMFELLLTIPKVGPKSALQILTQATPSLIIESTQKHDSVYLHKLSGIGKKTCENIVQFLQNKVSDLSTDEGVNFNSANQIQTDAIDALIALGYDTTTAREVILNLDDESMTVNSLVTLALKQIK